MKSYAGSSAAPPRHTAQRRCPVWIADYFGCHAAIGSGLAAPALHLRERPGHMIILTTCPPAVCVSLQPYVPLRVARVCTSLCRKFIISASCAYLCAVRVSLRCQCISLSHAYLCVELCRTCTVSLRCTRTGRYLRCRAQRVSLRRARISASHAYLCIVHVLLRRTQRARVSLRVGRVSLFASHAYLCVARVSSLCRTRISA